MDSLANRKFRLTSNPDGLVSGETIMLFGPGESPFLGTYTGPETKSGQVVAAYENDGMLRMIYQSLTTDLKLVAGKADVSFSSGADGSVSMVLNWQWLTKGGSGRSVWLEIR